MRQFEIAATVVCDILFIMNCMKCNTKMHKRAAKAPHTNVEVYVCPKCGAVVYIDRDGEQKWE